MDTDARLFGIPNNSVRRFAVKTRITVSSNTPKSEANMGTGFRPMDGQCKPSESLPSQQELMAIERNSNTLADFLRAHSCDNADYFKALNVQLAAIADGNHDLPRLTFEAGPDGEQVKIENQSGGPPVILSPLPPDLRK